MILLTGASGFVGTALAERLAKTYEVVGVDLAAPKEKVCSIVLGDLLERGFVKVYLASYKPTTIIHFAAQARVDPSYEDPIGTYRTNVEATVNLLELAKKLDARFVYASSEIIYGEADRYPVREVDHFRPDSPYAASKVAGDVLVSQCTGVESVVLRSGMGYGPRSPPMQVVTKFMLKCMDGKPLVFPAGDVKHPTRDMNYIANFGNGVVKVLEHPEARGVFNMGCGEEVDLLTLAQKVIRTVGKGEIKFDPGFKYRPSEEGKRTWLDNTKARMMFGYEPKIRLEEGLRLTYSWLKNGGRALYGW